MTNRSPKSGQRTAICHFSLVICHFLSLRSQRLCGEIRFGCGWAALCSSVVSFILLVADNFSQSLAALLDSHLLILSKLWDCHLFGDQRGYNCPLCLSFPERGWVRTRSPSPSGRAEWERFIARPTRAWGAALPSRYCRATGRKTRSGSCGSRGRPGLSPV